MRKFFSRLFLYAVITSSVPADEVKDPWKGSEYAKNSESQKSSAEDLIAGLNLQNPSVILDVGCGDGKITAALAEAVPEGRVIGVDISPSMIEFAEKAFPNRSNLAFLVQDAARLDFQEKFDLITSFTVMQWVLEQQQALEGFEKALKPGGKLCIQMPTGLPVALQQALDEIIRSKKWGSYFTGFSPPWKFYGPEEYRELVVNAHLTPDRIGTAVKHEKFPSKEVFTGFLRQWFPYLRPLPSDLKDTFLQELIDRYLQILPIDPSGRVSFIVTRLEVEARK